MLWRVLVGLLLLPSMALAGEIYFVAGSFGGMGTNSCQRVDNVNEGIHSYVSRDCDKAVTEGMTREFWYPGDALTTGTPFTITVVWRPAVVDVASVQWEVDMGCGGDGQEWDSHAYGTAEQVISAPQDPITELSYATISNPIGAFNAANNVMCHVRVKRIFGGLDGDAKFVGLRVQY